MDERILKTLASAISESVKAGIAGESKPGVMFSGGLDSSIIAFLAHRFNPKTWLYTIGTRGSQDVLWARAVAGEIGAELCVVELGENEVARAYAEVAGILKTDNLLEIELGFPPLLCSRAAKKDGVGLLLSGHGADELFGGYGRYPGKFAEGMDVGTMMKKDLEKVISKDAKSAGMIAGKSGVGVAFPFLSPDVMDVAQSIPIGAHYPKSLVRKPVLREVAGILGVPKSARDRPKKALQYGNGTHKLILRMKRGGKLRG